MSNQWISDTLNSNFNPAYYRQIVAEREAQDASNFYAKMLGLQPGQVPSLQGIDPNSNAYYDILRQGQLISSSPMLIEQGQRSMQQHQGDVFSQANLPTEYREYLLTTSSPTEEGFMQHMLQKKRAGATSVSFMQPGSENRPVDKAIQETLRDANNNPLSFWATEGMLANMPAYGIQFEAKVPEGQAKNATYDTMMKIGRDITSPLYEGDSLLSPSMKKKLEGNNFFDTSVMGAKKDQFLINNDTWLPEFIIGEAISPEGKKLRMGHHLITQPILRTMTGATINDTERPSVDAMFAPSIYDDQDVSNVKRTAVGMMNSIYHGQATGKYVNPISPEDVFLGSMKTSDGKEVSFGYNQMVHPRSGKVVNQIYMSLPDGRNVKLTQDELNAILSQGGK